MVNLKKVVFMIYYCFNENNMWLRCLNSTYAISVYSGSPHYPFSHVEFGTQCWQNRHQRMTKSLKKGDYREEKYIAQEIKPKTICHDLSRARNHFKEKVTLLIALHSY